MFMTLGEYAGSVPVTLITEKRQSIGGTSSEIMQLKGVRYAVMAAAFYPIACSHLGSVFCFPGSINTLTPTSTANWTELTDGALPGIAPIISSIDIGGGGSDFGAIAFG
jgi:hypothetical protein